MFMKYIISKQIDPIVGNPLYKIKVYQSCQYIRINKMNVRKLVKYKSKINSIKLKVKSKKIKNKKTK